DAQGQPVPSGEQRRDQARRSDTGQPLAESRPTDDRDGPRDGFVEKAADVDTDGTDALHLDQPVDDTPPASLASPPVREAWLARIRQLMADGRHDEARASFAEFRRRHPDARVPDDLRG